MIFPRLFVPLSLQFREDVFLMLHIIYECQCQCQSIYYNYDCHHIATPNALILPGARLCASGVCIMRVIAAYYALVLGPASGGQASVLVEDRAVIVLIL